MSGPDSFLLLIVLVILIPYYKRERVQKIMSRIRSMKKSGAGPRSGFGSTFPRKGLNIGSSPNEAVS